ncbi:MAG TPA: hypothetical protein VMU93_11095 [Caulobacteraceae bacterium]|nr:hypothetical protein [Caulobacteraceae bacterium]
MTAMVRPRSSPPIAPTRGGVAARRAVRVRLWLPLTPLFAVLAPLALLGALLATPLLTLVPAARGASPLRAAWRIGALLLLLSGIFVEVDSPKAVVRIHVV